MLANIQYENFENAIRYLYDAQGRIVVTLGEKSYIAKSRCDYGGNSHILIGNYCSIAHDVCFIIGMNHAMQWVTTYPQELIGNEKLYETNDIDDIRNFYQVCIGHDVWIGEKATILGGVKIGNGAVIGAAAVVTKDVPPYAIVGGNPAKIIRYRFDPDIIGRLQTIKWWYWNEAKIIECRNQFKNVRQFTADFYQVSPAEEMRDTLSQSLKKLRQEEYKLYYFIPDFQLQDGVWEHVIQQFIKLYTAQDKVALLLELHDKEKNRDKIGKIFSWLQEKGEVAPLVVEVSSQKSGTLAILQNIDAFITTKEYSSIQCIDYGYDYNVNIKCGLNKNVFDM